jgi:hypothetical protein
MKTFDEAVAKILSEPIPLFAENLNQSLEHIDNKDLFTGVRSMASALIVRLLDDMQQGTPELVIFTNVCAQLHKAVSFGMLIGMEMEKQDAPVESR